MRHYSSASVKGTVTDSDSAIKEYETEKKMWDTTKKEKQTREKPFNNEKGKRIEMWSPLIKVFLSFNSKATLSQSVSGMPLTLRHFTLHSSMPFFFFLFFFQSFPLSSVVVRQSHKRSSTKSIGYTSGVLYTPNMVHWFLSICSGFIHHGAKNLLFFFFFIPILIQPNMELWCLC